MTPTPFQIVGKGVRRLGRLVTSPLRWAGKQIEKEMKMNDEKDKQYRAEGAALNKEYSGAPSLGKRRSTSTGSMR